MTDHVTPSPARICLLAASTILCLGLTVAAIAMHAFSSPELPNAALNKMTMIGIAGWMLVLCCSSLVPKLRALYRDATLCRQAEARFHHAAESNPQGLIFLSPVRTNEGRPEDFNVNYVNRSARQTFDIPYDAPLGGRLLETLPELTADGLFSKCVTALESGAALHADLPSAIAGEPPLRYTAVRHGDGVVLTLTVGREPAFDQIHIDRLIGAAARTAPLTGLAARSLLDDRIKQSIERAKRNQHSIAVLMLELQNFVALTEPCGPNAGELVLKSVADRLRSATRATDSIFRLGVSTFVIVFSDLNGSVPVSELMRKLSQSLAPPVQLGPRNLQLTPGFGVAMYPDAGATPEVLLARAESAMLQARHPAAPSRLHIADRREVVAA